MLQYIGSYWPDEDLSVASTIGNFVILGYPELMGSNGHGWPSGTGDRLRTLGMKVITGPPALEQDDLLNVDGRLEDQLRRMRVELEHAGLMDRVLAMTPSEEWYLRLKSGGLDHWPLVHEYKQRFAHADPMTVYVGLARSLCGALAGVADAIHRVFPGMLVGHVEPHWENDPAAGYNYHPVVPGYDFLGVDQYVHGRITREAWERIVDRAYAGTSRYGKPILMVPQAFNDGDSDSLWAEMPTMTQLAWWGELPERYPLIQAAAYFCLKHPTIYDARHGTRGYGLTDFPDRLAMLQEHWRSRQA